LAHRQIQAGETTPYLSFERRVAEHIPAGSRVLGLHGHWLGLSEYPFTSWWAVLNMADADRYHAEVSLAQAMERAAPDVILMDDNMRTVFDRAAKPTAARHEQYLSYLEFLRAHEVELAATVEDPTYGTMRILRVPRDNR
jgi:hypothetical protein